MITRLLSFKGRWILCFKETNGHTCPILSNKCKPGIVWNTHKRYLKPVKAFYLK